jgi:hypothetical protein
MRLHPQVPVQQEVSARELILTTVALTSTYKLLMQLQRN